VALKIRVAGKTDTGLVRPQNEDCLHIDESHRIFAVCDGMGGHLAGEVASHSASETLRTVFALARQPLLSDERLSVGRRLPENGDLLLRAIRLANREIYNRAAADSTQTGMGTTIVAVAPEADALSIAHVGDSRAYRIDDRQLTPLTTDHSWVAEMQATHRISPEEAGQVVGKNIITRALGVRENVEVDYRLIHVKPGDTFLLCSDGLCGFANDDEIFTAVRDLKDDLEALCSDLVQMANDRGGQDNVTVLALQVEEVEELSLPEVPVFTLKAEAPDLLAHEDEWLEKLRPLRAQTESAPRSGGVAPTRGWLLMIFAAFIVVAVAIIYFSASR